MDFFKYKNQRILDKKPIYMNPDGEIFFNEQTNSFAKVFDERQKHILSMLMEHRFDAYLIAYPGITAERMEAIAPYIASLQNGGDALVMRQFALWAVGQMDISPYKTMLLAEISLMNEYIFDYSPNPALIPDKALDAMRRACRYKSGIYNKKDVVCKLYEEAKKQGKSDKEFTKELEAKMDEWDSRNHTLSLIGGVLIKASVHDADILVRPYREDGQEPMNYKAAEIERNRERLGLQDVKKELVT